MNYTFLGSKTVTLDAKEKLARHVELMYLTERNWELSIPTSEDVLTFSPIDGRVVAGSAFQERLQQQWQERNFSFAILEDIETGVVIGGIIVIEMQMTIVFMRGNKRGLAMIPVEKVKPSVHSTATRKESKKKKRK